MSGRKLPDSVKAAIKRQQPGEAWRIGEGPRPASSVKPAPLSASRLTEIVDSEINKDGTITPIREAIERTKWGNKKTTDPDTGEVFDSALEWKCYRALVAEFGVRCVARQVSIPLPGGVRIRPDFVVFSPCVESFDDDPSPRIMLAVIDAKGPPPTRDWINKRKALFAALGVKISIAKTPGDAVSLALAAKHKSALPTHQEKQDV